MRLKRIVRISQARMDSSDRYHLQTREVRMIFKIVSAVAAGSGIGALALATVAVFTQRTLMGGTGAGWMRLASSLFLLAIFMILFDREYGPKADKRSRVKD
jgi:hypothetical protein